MGKDESDSWDVHNLFLGDVVSQIKSGFIAGIAARPAAVMPLYLIRLAPEAHEESGKR